jgi:hypothetical protein
MIFAWVESRTHCGRRRRFGDAEGPLNCYGRSWAICAAWRGVLARSIGPLRIRAGPSSTPWGVLAAGWLGTVFSEGPHFRREVERNQRYFPCSTGAKGAVFHRNLYEAPYSPAFDACKNY